SRILEPDCRDDYLHRICADIFTAIHCWQPWHAATVLSICARIPGSQCPVISRRIHPWCWVCLTTGLSDLVLGLRQESHHQRLETQGVGMENAIAPAAGQFRGDTRRDRPALSVRQGGAQCPLAPPTWLTTLPTLSNNMPPPRSGCGHS